MKKPSKPKHSPAGKRLISAAQEMVAHARSASEKYRGYESKVVFDEATGIFTGEVLNTRDVITFQGTTAEEAGRAFRASVDDYLEFCKSRGEEPEKPKSMSMDAHRAEK